MINTNKKNDYQVPGTPIKQLLGKDDAVAVPSYGQVRKVCQNVDRSRFEDYMLFQSAAVRLRLRLQRLFISYPFVKTRDNASKDFLSFSAVTSEVQDYFGYIQNASVFEKYVIGQTKTSNISLTSDQGDIIVIPYFDLNATDTRRRFEASASRLRQRARQFDNGIITKSFWGLQDDTRGLVVNRNQDFSFTDRDATYERQVPRRYKQSVNRRGRIFNLLPAVYHKNDAEFESLLNVMRQNYDKIWFKNKAIRNIKKISYDKNRKQYLGNFLKQSLRNRGIDYYDINPGSISNIVLYNYVPKNIDPRNVDYIPIGFSYRYLSDQFSYRMFTQKNLLIRARGTRQPLQRLVNIYGLRNRATGDFSRNPTWNDIIDFERYYDVDVLFRRDMRGTGSYTDLESTMDDQVFDSITEV